VAHLFGGARVSGGARGYDGRVCGALPRVKIMSQSVVCVQFHFLQEPRFVAPKIQTETAPDHPITRSPDFL
jgi:hypothetical protein